MKDGKERDGMEWEGNGKSGSVGGSVGKGKRR
jgi:hypothetical protein